MKKFQNNPGLLTTQEDKVNQKDSLSQLMKLYPGLAGSERPPAAEAEPEGKKPSASSMKNLNKFNLEDSSYLRMKLAYQVNLRRVEKNYPIKFEHLIFGKQIGETAFGRMYEGIYRLRTVVIKR